MDGPGIECRWGKRLPATVQTCPGAHPGHREIDTGSLLRVKLSGRTFDHPPSSIAEVKGRVELYIFPSGSSWLVPGERNLYLYLYPGSIWTPKSFAVWHCVVGWEDKGTTNLSKRRESHSIKHRKKWIHDNIKYSRINIFCNEEAMCFLWISNISCL